MVLIPVLTSMGRGSYAMVPIAALLVENQNENSQLN